ncbi:DUF1127 domain-containing protein [Zestomonas thermotolerans]|jgi:uncharacterized protein YjiS (DUF1127 family)|uniref:DUF1127 domain-containing protein n=1 Tax=Zestomonas thermotolerans TaxID=157784 RepID=UPI0004814DF9|nr:DUF1127 domain-containing protein [Pseudomonas thermotolerans]
MKGQFGFAGTPSTTKDRPVHPSWLKLAWRKVRRWHELAYQRRQLASLSDEMLKDIGLSRADVMQESERPFWDDSLDS